VKEFSRIMGDLTTARKEKRAAARKFEEEIAGRHEEVVAQREGIEQALSSIREKGQALMAPSERASDSKEVPGA